MIDRTPGNYADLDYSGMHELSDPDTDEVWGGFEVFQGKDYDIFVDSDGDLSLPDSWYWWICFAGCLPDGDPIGPFATSADAYHDAQGF